SCSLVSLLPLSSRCLPFVIIDCSFCRPVPLLFYPLLFPLFFFFNDTATTEIYTLSLHDALPISSWSARWNTPLFTMLPHAYLPRSEEHTSELQSRFDLVCRLLLEKKKTQGSSQYCRSMEST